MSANRLTQLQNYFSSIHALYKLQNSIYIFKANSFCDHTQSQKVDTPPVRSGQQAVHKANSFCDHTQSQKVDTPPVRSGQQAVHKVHFTTGMHRKLTVI